MAHLRGPQAWACESARGPGLGKYNPPMLSVPLADFARDAQAHVARIKATKAPETLTVDGRGEVVVLDAEGYQALLDRIEKVELVESLRQGIRDAEAGKGRDAEEFFAEMDAKYGL